MAAELTLYASVGFASVILFYLMGKAYHLISSILTSDNERG